MILLLASRVLSNTEHKVYMTQALVIFLPILWPLIPSKNTYLDTHSYKCASLCLKSVLQPYRVLLFSHALISIFDIFEPFKQTYGPCSSLFELRERGRWWHMWYLLCCLRSTYCWLLAVCFINSGLWIHFKWGFIWEKFCALYPELRFCPSRMILLLFLTDTTEILSVWEPYVKFLAWGFLNTYLV